MTTYSWGNGGTTRGISTSSPGNGWVTGDLPLPNVRQAYNGSRVIQIAKIEPIAGTGDRTAYFYIGRSGWLQSGTLGITDNSTFLFRIARDSGTIQIGFDADDQYYTEWLNGSAIAGLGRGRQPGRMTYYEVPSAPFTRLTPSPTVVGQVAVTITEPTEDGGRPVTLYTNQIATDAGFTNLIAEWTSSGSTTRSGLPTRRVLFHRAMAINAVTASASGLKGGAASTTRSFSLGTAVVNAPGLNVASGTSGRNATAFITPPTNGGGLPITGYETQTQYLSPDPIPSPATVTRSHTTTVLTITPLVPGATYRHRTRARNTLGWGPYSAWVTEVQSRPSFNPGDYFDGSTAAETDTTYSWTSTVNKSISIASSPGVLGWAATTDALSGGIVLTRASGGLSGDFSAKVTVKADIVGGFVWAGQANIADYRSIVLPESRYTGSIRVRLQRAQRMVAEIAWIDSGGTIFARSNGEEVVVPKNNTFTLSVEAESPAGAAYAIIRARDTGGSGHVPWRSGETYLVDAAILSFGGPYSYFDGSFPAKQNYEYEWAGTPHNSISARHTVDRFVNPLVDPDCAVVPAPPRPPVVPNYCIEEVGIWRRIWHRIESEDVREFLDTIPILTISTGSFAERQIRVRFYASPFSRELPDLDPADFCAELIVSFLPADSVLTLDGVTQSAWASVAGGETLNANHLIYGSDGMPGTWPVFECGIDYYIAVDVPPENEDGNVTLSLDLLTRF